MKSDFYLPGIGDSMVFGCKSTRTQHCGDRSQPVSASKNPCYFPGDREKC